ncbi:hypothetical protein [Streptomyces sp. 3211]|uniref:hypothetical protein n=1 Tax=Streptomyces sp. 3211 TaxID=1964449 RepID=UPI0009A535E6|nr:hypothetical protein [Streptomyces sp. 3211]
MPDRHDPLRSLFQEAASAGQSAAMSPPVSIIERRGERHRRRRIVGIAAACLFVLAGSGAALSTFLPGDAGPILPATTPSPVAPSPTSAPPPQNTVAPPSSTTAPASTTTTTPSSSMTPPRNTTPPFQPTGSVEPSMSPTPPR